MAVRHSRMLHHDKSLAPRLLIKGVRLGGSGMNYPFLNTFTQRNRFAVILAGGDGVRLRSFVHGLRGDSLPKQYVKFFNDQSMLEATLQRARKLLPPEKQFVVVTESHFDYPEVGQQIANCPKIAIVVQPVNRDTGMGLLLPLALLNQRQPDASVAVFPSDHFIEEEESFLTHVKAAYDFVERDNSKIVLLGIPPNAPESEYGYILASNRWHNVFPFGAREVDRFIEKPNPILARKLMLRGGFWNTMVMVFKLKTLLEHLRTISPATYRGFERIYRAVGSANFEKVVKQVFAQAQPFNLSTGFLETLPVQRGHNLLVLPVRGVHWSDWGSAARILKTLELTENGSYGVESSTPLFNSLLKRSLAGST